MKTLSNVAVVLAAVGLAACSSSRDAVEVDVVRSAQQRDMSPQLSDAEQATLARGQANFAVDIYQAVRKQPESVDKDIFLSPHSASIASLRPVRKCHPPSLPGRS